VAPSKNKLQEVWGAQAGKLMIFLPFPPTLILFPDSGGKTSDKLSGAEEKLCTNTGITIILSHTNYKCIGSETKIFFLFLPFLFA
jgi:hypothetical protein